MLHSPPLLHLGRKTIPRLGLGAQSAGVGEINHEDCWLTYQPNSFPLTGGDKWSFLDPLRITKYFLRHDANHIFLCTCSNLMH